jgi:hypothetical protein
VAVVYKILRVARDKNKTLLLSPKNNIRNNRSRDNGLLHSEFVAETVVRF